MATTCEAGLRPGLLGQDARPEPSMPRQILVTAALPYVNGHIHLGHLVEYIQADIWVRFQRMQPDHDVAFICADDTHGTATMIRARQEGRSEQQIMAEMSEAHQKDFAEFGVEFSHYGSTDSASNKQLVGEIWAALRAAKDETGAAIVADRDVTQLFDPKAGSFLADRFVKGTCPKCKSPDQYGDSCDKCASTFSPTDLIDPVSTLSGAKPELRSAKHYFVRLEPFRAFLKEWTRSTVADGSATLQPEIANWLHGTFLSDELRDWDVSRPAPYFGFEIPDAPGNYFYVWVDAPVGYLASLTDACAAGKVSGAPRQWWPKIGDAGYADPAVEIHHFIGKDITYFHTLFWPAMLKTAHYKLPTQVHVHGFLTVEGEKMSKSKGTFIRARAYLDAALDPAYLRYYFASKLNAKVEDIDLNLTEFADKVNSDVVGKVVNLASRTAKFAQGGAWPQTYAETGFGVVECTEIAVNIVTVAERVALYYNSCDYSAVTRELMQLADQANEFVERLAPWKLAKDPANQKQLVGGCSIALKYYWSLVVMLRPILPKLAEATEALFDKRITCWEDVDVPLSSLSGIQGRPFVHLLARLDPVKVQTMVDASKVENPVIAAPAASTTVDDGAALSAEPLAGTIAFEDFGKIDLRVARILSAEDVPKAKKILKLTVTLGGDDRRTVFAGIKTAYGDPTKLVGRLIVIVANLAAKPMSFGTSEGMAIAAGPGGSDIFLLSPDSGAKPGQRVH
jgi:methionyl-tRNA synthetase